METLTFLGRVLPSNVGIAVPKVHTEFLVEALSLRLSLDFDVVASDLVVVAQVDGAADIPTICNYVVEAVSSVLDAAGVIECFALSIEMRSVVLPDGQRVGLDPRHPNLAEVLGGLTQAQLLAAMNVAPTRMGYVLRDMRLALADPATSAFWCYRAVENISRHWVSSDDTEDPKGKRWGRMYEALGNNKADIMRCKALADRPRHGHNEVITAVDRDFVLSTAWSTLGRYARWLQPVDSD